MGSCRRGSVEIQFNWIFVVLVGAVILLFFYSVVRVQQRTSDTEIGYQTAVDLDSILTSALESTGTLNIIKIPETTIDFTCYEYYINNVNRPFNDKVVFAPGRLQGKRLMTWALDWNAPFKVVNFLFITNPEVRYVVMKPSSGVQKDMADFVESVMPDELVVESYDESKKVPFKNDYLLRLVYFRDSSFDSNSPPPLPDSLKSAPDNVVSAVVVSGSDVDAVGNVYFYRKKGNSLDASSVGSFPYLRYESVLAAIFSEDARFFSCGMKKALFRMDFVSKVYAMKRKALYDFYLFNNDPCKDYLASSAMDSLANKVHDMVSSSKYFYSDFNQLYSYVVDAMKLNRDTVAQSCARVY